MQAKFQSCSKRTGLYCSVNTIQSTSRLVQFRRRNCQSNEPSRSRADSLRLIRCSRAVGTQQLARFLVHATLKRKRVEPFLRLLQRYGRGRDFSLARISRSDWFIGLDVAEHASRPDGIFSGKDQQSEASSFVSQESTIHELMTRVRNILRRTSESIVTLCPTPQKFQQRGPPFVALASTASSYFTPQ